MDVRAEYEEFFQAAYPWLVSQVHAITGDRMSARSAVETAFDGCWQRWAAVRRLTDPLTWVRWAALRAAAQDRGTTGLRRRPVAPKIATDTDEGVVLAALQKLPWSQRQAVVLHYMGDVPVEELARRSGTTADAVDWLLDTGFDALVEMLGWPSVDTEGSLAGPSIGNADADAGDADVDPRYDWTAEALSDTAMVLAADVAVPDPSAVLQRAAVLRWAKRTAPIAVSAACVSSIVVLAAQLSPGGTDAPRTPTIYVAEPSPGDEGGGYTEVRVPPVVDGRITGGGVTAPLPYLGMKILPVAQSTSLEDFGVSAPGAADSGTPVQSSVAGASGSSTRAGATGTGTGTGTAGTTTGGTTTTTSTPTPAAGGGETTTSPGSGSSGGGSSVPPASTSPATTPPTTSPVTTPPTTPATTPPTTTTTPPPVTTDPPVVTTTTEPPVPTTTTEPVATTTLAAETTTTTAPTTTTTETTTTTTTAAEESTASGGA